MSLVLNEVGDSQIEDLLAGRLFSAIIEVSAPSADIDNPILLLRNPANSNKNYLVYQITAGTSIVNVVTLYKLFGGTTFGTTAAAITNITQPSLSTTVTVTTAVPHGATVGTTATITGTTNFNGAWTVTAVSSTTVYTFTRTPAPVSTITETSGTSTVQSSLGTSITSYALKRIASPAAATGLVTSQPTTTSNGVPLAISAAGQNTHTAPILLTPVFLAPGQSVLVTANPSSNNREVAVTAVWSEIAL